MNITITRAQLVALNACVDGLDAWDRVSDACGVSRDSWDLEWTRDAQILALACPEWRPFFGWLVRVGVVPAWSMARADLAGADLAGADLAGANLAHANLAHADLAGADLAGANLADAYLAGAYLAGAYLAGADLAGANLADAYLAGAYLADAYLADADLAGANLADAYLAHAYRYSTDAPIPGWTRGYDGRLVRAGGAA